MSTSRPEPFFLKVSFIRPHSPYDPPERFMRMYAETELPAARAGKWAARYEQRNSDRDDIWRGKLAAAEIRRSRQGYYGSISHVDEQIGRILESLEKRGWLDETLIVFTSDHGDMTGDQNLWRKSYPYEPSAHIPMMMRWPTGLLAARAGRRLRSLSSCATSCRPLWKLPPRRSIARSTAAACCRWSAIPARAGASISISNTTSATAPRITGTRSPMAARSTSSTRATARSNSSICERDPYELDDLAGDPHREAELRLWRQRLVAHFAERGEPFLKGGKLGLRPEGMMLSPQLSEDIRRVATPPPLD